MTRGVQVGILCREMKRKRLPRRGGSRKSQIPSRHTRNLDYTIGIDFKSEGERRDGTALEIAYLQKSTQSEF